MKNLLSIGKVAKLKNVSIKSLRYYDEIGVLKPAFINVHNNYRYYTEEQLYLLDAITMCIELGIPLKDLLNYVDMDSINLNLLLNDGKILADKKINEIYGCLKNLEKSINHLNENSSILLKKATYERLIEERTILTIPLEDTGSEDTGSFSNYTQKILKLFMLAQLLDINATYPSGITYLYKNNTLEKHIFLHVENTIHCLDSRIQTLKCGDYLCMQHVDHKINTGTQLFSSVCNNRTEFCIIETDIIDESIRKNKNTLELQILL